MGSPKHCIIFGGSRGIGAAIYHKLASEKYNITVVSRSAKSIQNFFEKNTNNGSLRPLVMPCDVTSEESVNKTIQVAQKWFGPPDVLVNAAGVNKDSLMMKAKISDVHEIINTNLVGSMITSKAVLRSMVQRKSGCIINIGSVVGIHGNSGQCAYSASKAGLVGFTKSLAKEIGSRGVRVNLVAPGFIETDMTLNVDQASIIGAIPLQRFGQPPEVAEAVKFIIENDYITGEVIYVDGGLHLNS